MDIKKILIDKLKLAESTVSMILGAMVVVVVGVLLFNYFRGGGKEGKITIPGEATEVEILEGMTEAEKEVEAKPTPVADLPGVYITQKGDDLWKIAKLHYGSGYNWVDIAKENSLKNTDLLAVGQELTVPDVSVRQPNVELPKTGVSAEIANETEAVQLVTGDQHLVVEGDTLWNIAVGAYGDGFKWVEIAKVNDLANPNLIHPGNVLQLPR